MKKAILTFGLLSLVMVLTSFTTPETTTKIDNTTTVEVVSGSIIPNKKFDVVDGSIIPNKKFDVVDGSIIPNKKFDVVNGSIIPNKKFD